MEHAPGSRFVLMRLFVLIAIALLAIIGWNTHHQLGNVAASQHPSEEAQTIAVYKSSSDAVVFISTLTLTVDPFDVMGSLRPHEGSGSGVIIDSEKGYILTNLHVIQDAHQIEILLADGQSYRARLVGHDSEYDIAVLQVVKPPDRLVSLEFADSSGIQVGQNVLAIGNPHGLNMTLTKGIISSLQRTVRNPNGYLMKGLIQTDAAINPGNSGGPLLDLNGRMIGMNTALISQSGDSAGIGFAVPTNQIRKILPELVATGRVLRPKIGWILVDTSHGPVVRRVVKGGPAEKAGLQPLERPVESVFLKGFVRDFENSDLIIAVDGQPVVSREQVDDLVSQAKRGQTLKITVRQGGAPSRERVVILNPILG